VAFQNNDVSILPAKSKKTAVKDVWMVYFFIHHNGQTYIKRRDESGIWKGLYDFPVVESERAIDPETTASTFLSENFKSEKPEVRAVSSEYTHILSHRKIHAWFITITLHTIWKKPHKNLQKVDRSRLSEYGIPRLIDRFLADFDADKL
jgi:A/G-specific adenine glycosylase